MHAIVLIAGSLDPHGQDVQKFGLETWLHLIVDGPDLVAAFPNARVSAFLLSIAFQHGEQESAELMAFCFQSVYDAAASDKLSYWSWSNLKGDVPTLSRSRDWDKCERLRQALLRHYIRHEWPPATFIRCLRDAKTLRRTLRSSKEVKGGIEFVTSVAEYALERTSEATQEQREVFEVSFWRNKHGEMRFDL